MLANQIGLSNKYVSERHYIASREKFTAGEAARELKKLKIVASAKEVVEAYKLIESREPEWHHAGFYKKAGKSTMGRTFFFTKNQISALAENWAKVAEKKAEIEAETKRKSKTKVQGFYFSWDYDWSGYRGKKRNFKVLQTYEGSELNMPPNFTELTPGEYLSAKLKEGKGYFGWDEPLKSEFESISKIKYNRVIKDRIDAKEKTEKERLEAIRRKKIEAEKAEMERIEEKIIADRKKEQAHEEAIELLKNCTNKDELIAVWKQSGCIHPAPAVIVELKNASGLGWNQFTRSI